MEEDWTDIPAWYTWDARETGISLASEINKGETDMFKKFEQKFGEGTSFDLDYGKLMIIGLLIYHIFFQDVTWW